VIIGKLIPAATGLKRYRRIEIEPAEPLPRAIDEVGLLDQEEIAAELGLAGEALGGAYGQEFDADLASLEKIGAGGADPGFVEELAELEIPDESGEEWRPRSALKPIRPGGQRVGLLGREPPLRGSAHQQRGGRAGARPGVARLVEGVVDPRQRPRGGVGADRLELPVRVRRAPGLRRRREAQIGQRAGQSEQVGQVFVGLLLPAAGPHGLITTGQCEKVSGGRGRKEVRDAVDRVEGAVHVGLVEAEERKNAVDVDHQKRLCVADLPCKGAIFSSHSG